MRRAAVKRPQDDSDDDGIGGYVFLTRLHNFLSLPSDQRIIKYIRLLHLHHHHLSRPLFISLDITNIPLLFLIIKFYENILNM